MDTVRDGPSSMGVETGLHSEHPEELEDIDTGTARASQRKRRAAYHRCTRLLDLSMEQVEAERGNTRMNEMVVQSKVAPCHNASNDPRLVFGFT